MNAQIASWHVGGALGFGECVVQTRVSPKTFDDELIVQRADPRVLISAELLNEIARADSPFASLNGDVLTINGSNQKVIYRISEYLMLPDCYVAEWPD